MSNLITNKPVLLIVCMLVSVSVAYGNYEGNNAISLDGTDDYVHVGGISELGITGDGGTFKYTVEGWFMLKAGNEGERRCLWESEGYTIACEVNADSLIHYNVNSTISGSEGYLNHVTDIKPELDTWHHIAVVVENNTSSLHIESKFYYDGNLIDGKTFDGANLNSVGNYFNLGAHRDAGRFFPGQLDEVRIWNVARTQQEIQDNMYKTLTRMEEGLVAYHRFDESSGTDVPGLSRNVLNGTWYGATGGAYTAPYWVASDVDLELVPLTVVVIALPPSNVAGSGFTANWQEVENVTNYYIDVATDVEFTSFLSGYENKNVGTATSEDITNLTEGTNYYYRVRALINGQITPNFNIATVATTMDAPGYALEFDGEDDYVNISGINHGGITDPSGGGGGTLQYTSEGWFMLKVGNEGQRQFLWESTFYTISLEIDPSLHLKYHVNFGPKTGGSGYINVVTDVQPGPDIWHHVAVTVDARNNDIFAMCYYDGELISESSVNNEFLTEVGDHINIGAHRDGGRNFKGVIDEVRFWNVVRTQEEIKEYMYQSLEGNEPGLFAYHRFDHTSGLVSVDMTSNHYDGAWNGTLSGDYTEPHWIPSGAMSEVVYATKALNATNVKNTSFTANWESVEDVTHYYLDVATDEEFTEIVGGFENFDVGANTSNVVPGLNSGTNYYYRVGISDTSDIKSNTIYVVTSMDPPGNVLAFDGQDDYIHCYFRNFLGITGPHGTYQYTVEGWFKLDPGLEGTRRTLWQTEQYYTISLEVNSDGYLFYEIGADSGEYSMPCKHISGIQPTPGEWNHVAVIVENSADSLVSTLVYNGVNAASETWQDRLMRSTRYTFYIGTYREFDGRWFIGSIDEVRIWNLCRTVTEIKDNMQRILTGNEPGLACYYRFDHVSGDQLYDYSPNGNHAEWHGSGGFYLFPFWLPSDAFVPVGIDDNKRNFRPDEFTLYRNFPNPFNPATTIRYNLPIKEEVRLVIYDLLGREVKTLVNRVEKAGLKSVIWEGKNNTGQNVSSGVYLFRIQAGNYIKSQKMILLK